MNIKIRKLKNTDTTNLFEFFGTLGEKSRNFFHPHPFDLATAEHICISATKKDVYIVATDTNKIVGYGFLVGMTNPKPVFGIGISDSHQGKGIGNKLMSKLITIAKQKRKQGITLTVYKDNTRAYSLYKKMGFKLVRVNYHMQLDF
jgi:ribosomal protein S18 acetylase RimI-like enzyme